MSVPGVWCQVRRASCSRGRSAVPAGGQDRGVLQGRPPRVMLPRVMGRSEPRTQTTGGTLEAEVFGAERWLWSALPVPVGAACGLVRGREGDHRPGPVCTPAEAKRASGGSRQEEDRGTGSSPAPGPSPVPGRILRPPAASGVRGVCLARPEGLRPRPWYGPSSWAGRAVMPSAAMIRRTV